MKRRQLGLFVLLYAIAIGAMLLLESQAVQIGLIALSAIALGWLIWYVEFRTERPLRRFGSVLGKLRDGDEGAVSVLSDADSEAGDVIRAFNAWQAVQRHKSAQMQRELDRLRAVFGQMSDGVIITNPMGDIHSINSAALGLFDLSVEQTHGSTFAELVRHHEIIELWQRAVRDESAVSNVVEIGRTQLFLKVSVTPLFENNELVNLAAILSDLTTVRRLETVRRDFISNISHELRTPIASMRAVIETLQDGAMDDPPIAHKFLRRAIGEADAMTQMIEELLELSRIESGRVPLRIEPVPIQVVVDSAIERLHEQAERKSVRLESEISAEFPNLYIDPMRVEQVLTNLLTNAIKFTPESGRIHVDARLQEDMLLVGVHDTGIGISAHALPRIFERFYKIDQARTSRGTGLGLSIAKHIVQIHGGDIWAKSRPNKGSSFFFTLPTVLGDEPVSAETLLDKP